MKRLFCLLTIACNLGCNNISLNSTQELDIIEEITCKHPRGHIIVYRVSSEEARLPFNFRGGLWSFKTINGRKVKTTNCHLETNDQ